MPGWLRLVLLVLLAVIALILVAVNCLLLPRLDSMLSDAVRRELSLEPAATVIIKRGSLVQTIQGFLPRFHVHSTEAVVDDCQVELLEFTATDIDFNMERIISGEKAELTSIGTAQLTICVNEQQVLTRLEPMIIEEGIMDPELVFEDDGVKVSGKRKVKYLGKVKLSAKGMFIADGTDKVRLKITEVEVGQFNLGVSGLNLETDETLPVLDLGGLYAAVIIDSIETSPGLLLVKAHSSNIKDAGGNGELVDVFD